MAGFNNPFKSAGDIASGLQWVRWMTQGGREQSRAGVMLLLAIGPNSIAASMDLKLDAEDAIAMLEAEANTIAELLRSMKNAQKTHHFIARRP
jgi:hypothetical protein